MTQVHALSDDDPRWIAESSWKILGRLSASPEKNVFLATNGPTKAAVKILGKQFGGNEEEWLSWTQEVEVLKVAEHKHIPKLLDYDFTDANSPWIATEYVPGRTLEDLVLQHGPLDEITWLRLLHEAAATLSAIHSQGIVHKDISPSNIVIHESVPYFIDFELAEFLEGSRNITSSHGGTEATVSPEHLNEILDPAMDVFSLGSTFVFAATGKFPFGQRRYLDTPNDDKQEIVIDWANQILYMPPKLDGLSVRQQKVIKPMLFKNPSLRISATDLAKSISDEPVGKDQYVQVNELILGPFLRSSNKKLKSKHPLSGKRRRIRQVAALALGAFVASTAYFTGFVTEVVAAVQERRILDCVNYLKVGDLNSSTRSCLEDYKRGIREASPYLALSYYGKRLDGEAEKVLRECQSFDPICRAIFYGRVVDNEKVVMELERSNRSGFGPASYLLARYHDARGNRSEALAWARSGYEDRVPISSLYFSVLLFNSGDAKRALDVMDKSSISRADLIWNPELLEIDNVAERWTISLILSTGQIRKLEKYLVNCAERGVPYCMGELALFYEKEGRWNRVLKWGQLGSNNGDGASMYAMARYYRNLNMNTNNGKGAKNIERQIEEWMLLSARSGFLPAMRSAWFFELFNPNRGNVDMSEEDVQSACYWYLKALTTEKDEASQGFSSYFYSPENQDSNSLNAIMDSLNCTTRF